MVSRTWWDSHTVNAIGLSVEQVEVLAEHVSAVLSAEETDDDDVPGKHPRSPEQFANAVAKRRRVNKMARKSRKANRKK